MGCMRTVYARTALVAAVTLGPLALAGCGVIKPGSSNPTPGTWTPPSVSVSAPSVPSSVSMGDSTVVAYFGKTETVACQEGKSLNVTGGDNTLTITGPCDSVSITGYNNTVTFEQIGSTITVGGYGNKVTYKSGTPKVNNIGANNTIEKAS